MSRDLDYCFGLKALSEQRDTSSTLSKECWLNVGSAALKRAETSEQKAVVTPADRRGDLSIRPKPADADIVLKPQVHKVEKDESLHSIARAHLGRAATTDWEVLKHANEIAKLNGMRNDARLKEGVSISLPGRAKDGATISVDAEGNSRVVWPDGASRVDDKNGSGFYKVPNASGGFREHHWGGRPEDSYTIVRDRQGSYTILESNNSNPVAMNGSNDVRLKRTKIADLIETRDKDQHQTSKFLADMARFEQRAAREHLGDAEINKTYTQIARLLEKKGDGPLTELQRTRIAEQIISQAASPTSIDQGNHNSCSITTVEVRTYTRTPSDAARVVTDTALSGKYTAGDGTTVYIDPKPHDESKIHPPADGKRSHASELFQVATVNLKYEKQNASTNPPGKIKYEQTEGIEQLVDYGNLDSNGKPNNISDRPELWEEDLLLISNSITGKQETDFVMAHKGEAYGPNSQGQVFTFDGEQDLQQKLAQLHKDGKFPILIRVYSSNEPFYTDSGAGTAGGSGGPHSITLMKFIDGPNPKVEVDNQWGSKVDHNGTNAMSLRTLFLASKPVGSDSNIDGLKKEFDELKAKNADTSYVQLELLRQQFVGKKINDQEYVDALKKAIGDDTAYWDKLKSENKLDSGARKRTLQKLDQIVTHLSTEMRLPLMREENQKGLLTDAGFDNNMFLAAVEVAKYRTNNEASNSYDADKQRRFNLTTAHLKQYIGELPKDRADALRKKIAEDAATKSVIDLAAVTVITREPIAEATPPSRIDVERERRNRAPLDHET